MVTDASEARSVCEQPEPLQTTLALVLQISGGFWNWGLSTVMFAVKVTLPVALVEQHWLLCEQRDFFVTDSLLYPERQKEESAVPAKHPATTSVTASARQSPVVLESVASARSAKVLQFSSGQRR